MPMIKLQNFYRGAGYGACESGNFCALALHGPLELFFRGAMGEGGCHPNDCTRIKRMGNLDHMQSYALIATSSWYDSNLV